MDASGDCREHGKSVGSYNTIYIRKTCRGKTDWLVERKGMADLGVSGQNML